MSVKLHIHSAEVFVSLIDINGVNTIIKTQSVSVMQCCIAAAIIVASNTIKQLNYHFSNCISVECKAAVATGRTHEITY